MKNHKIMPTVLTVILLGSQLMLAQEQFQTSQSSLQESERLYQSPADKGASTATPDMIPSAPKLGLANRLNKEWRIFKDALNCMRQKGFRACNREQKKRIMVAGTALVAVMGGLGYATGYFDPSPWKKKNRDAIERLSTEIKKYEKKLDEVNKKLSKESISKEKGEPWRQKKRMYEQLIRNNTYSVKTLEGSAIVQEFSQALKKGNRKSALDILSKNIDNDPSGLLCFSVVYAFDEGIKLILEKGIDVNVRETNVSFKDPWISYHQTPLHVAVTTWQRERNNVARSWREHIARLLIQHGANPFIKDANGKTPLDMTTDEAFKQKLIGEYRLRRATIGYSIQRAADPATELLDPSKDRLPKLPAEIIREILKQAN